MPGEEVKSKRPTDSKFKQQKLNAWKPILTPRTVLPIFLVVGVAFIAVGIALFVASDGVKEQTWTYTKDCKQFNGTDAGTPCHELLSDNPEYTNGTKRCTCELPIELDSDFDGEEVYLYYALDNYYQNHRRYVKSRWDPQLRSTTTSGSSECDPLNTDDDGRQIAPCGLVANSLFNDTIRLVKCNNDLCDAPTTITLSGKDIAWKSDRDTKFRNPKPVGGDLCQASGFFNKSKPPAWPVPACKLGASDTGGVYVAQSPEFGSSGVGYENEDLIVWMRSAALPNFRKLYRKVVNSDDLTNGKYKFLIDYNYPVTSFSGEKHIVLSTTSWIGGKNPFLGICYLVVGSLCVLAGIIFLILQKFKGRELGADKYLNWDR